MRTTLAIAFVGLALAASPAFAERAASKATIGWRAKLGRSVPERLVRHTRLVERDTSRSLASDALREIGRKLGIREKAVPSIIDIAVIRRAVGQLRGAHETLLAAKVKLRTFLTPEDRIFRLEGAEELRVAGVLTGYRLTITTHNGVFPLSHKVDVTPAGHILQPLIAKHVYDGDAVFGGSWSDFDNDVLDLAGRLDRAAVAAH